MSLIQLPEEVIIMIVQKLDTKSVNSLYHTCTYLKNIVSMPGVVKECHMFMNTLATVNLFRTDFFKAIAPHLVELNLCCVPDLRKSYLVPAMRKMKCLQTIDLSYTNLNITDFIDIFEACPTIVNVALNYMVNKSGLSKICEDSVIQCQEVFKNFKQVHLVGSATNLLYSRLPFLLLQDAELDILKYTIAESDRLHTIYVPREVEHAHMVKFKQFFLCFLDWTTNYTYFGSFFMLPVLSLIDLSTIEAIIVIKKNFKEYSIYVTPTFQDYFQETFDVDPDKVHLKEFKDSMVGNAAIMIWNKASQEFDDSFYSRVTKLLKPYFPCDCELYNGSSVPKKYDWFYITPEAADKADNNCEKPPPPSQFRKKRIAPVPNVLNYDELFKTKERVQLSIVFDKFIRNPVTLPASCNYLQKLTFLSITGAVRFTLDFFELLFKNCVNLVTLNLESPSIYPCTIPISRTIHLSPGLKNFRLTDKKMDFENLFSSLSKCKTLENVHILELTTGENVDIGDPSVVIDECPNLYHLYIQAPMSEAVRIRKMQVLHNTKMSRNKNHLNLVLHVKSELDKIFYSYDPFLCPYNLNPIKHMM